ncbi:MAG: CapA family protein [Oscillospiraceae bacterium]|nr:CapA family protein [Oscillospiraceae bacterium]
MAKISITAAGDALMVKRFPEGYKGLEGVRDAVLEGDFSLVNAETLFSEFDCFPSQYSGGTWVNARPDVLGDILAYGFSMCGASNNHSMDYSYGGLFSTIETFKKYRVPYCGIGASLEEASAPITVENEKGKIAVIAISSTYNDAAKASLTAPDLPPRPGLNFLRFSTLYQITPEHMQALREIAAGTAINGSHELNVKTGFVVDDGTYFFGGIKFVEGEVEKKITKPNAKDVERTCAAIRKAKETHDAVIVMLHCHEIRGFEFTEQADFAVEFAHACIDAGATAIVGGGTHQLKPIEIYKGKPIFHSLGDFAFQNNSVEILPPDFKEKYSVPIDASAEEALNARSKGGKVGLHTDIANYLSVIPYFEVEDGEVKNIRLTPIELGFEMDDEIKGLPHIADAKTSEKICNQLNKISAEYGTRLSLKNGYITVE